MSETGTKNRASLPPSKRPWAAAFIVFVLAALVSVTTVLQYQANRMQSRRQAVVDLTHRVADDIESNLSRSLSTTYALAAVLRQNNGRIPNFPQLAREMLDLYPGISCLQLAPNGVIAEIVPLKGNEKAMGHNLLEDSKRNAEALRALQTRSLTLAGPFELIQGGIATIGRLPVFLKDRRGVETFWGFTTVLIRVPDLLKVASIEMIAERGYGYEIYRTHPDTGKKDVFSSAGRPLSNPVQHLIAVPNGQWTLSVEPEEGWYSRTDVWAGSLLVLLCSSISALAAWWLVRQPIVLQRMVDERTGELSEANAKLHREIAERKHAEDALLASEHKLRSIFASLSDVILILDAEGRYLEIAPTNTNLLYRPPQELLGKRLDDLFPRETADFFLASIENALRSGRTTSVDYSLTIEGEEFWFSGNVTPLASDQVVWSARDITQRKRSEDERLKLEKQMLHAQKLESLGVLAGGIAHDFNNILTAIIGNADLALLRLNKESPAVENLHRIQTASIRASDLARQMLAYSGKGRFFIEDLDLNRLVQEMGHMLEVSTSKMAVLRYNLNRTLPAITADATQVRQVIMNLVINASEAIGERSGVISITTGCQELSDQYLKDAWICEQAPAGLYVYLEVADTGCGMSKETIARIFDPFFTTKFTGRGLGMAAVLGIVRSHKGAIKVYSEPGKGTTFKILFPAGAMPAGLFERREGAGASWQGSGNVLLVDDEETIRALGSEMLKELGYQVVTAEDGRQGVEVFSGRSDIDLVILDLTMPHMDGEQCFRAIREIDPKVRVVMSSGFNEQEVSEKFVGKGLSGFVQKPYTLSSLKKVLSLIPSKGD